MKNFGADGWDVIQGQPTVSSCGTVQLFGGFNVFGANTYITKTFVNLPPHQKIRVKA